jgi:long-chain acyl-CoA synthetase
MKYPFSNLYELIQTQANKRKGKIALFDGDDKISYRDVLARVDKLAAYMENAGVGREDKVALLLRNSPEFIYSVFAISKLGAVAVPINTFLKGDEISYILEDSDSKLLLASTTYKKAVDDSRADELCEMIIWEGEMEHTDKHNIPFVEALATSLDVGATALGLDDTAVIIYTSGTTGKPKGAMLSNRNLMSNADSSRQAIGVNAKDRSIVFLPMFHSFTFTVAVLLFLYVGGSIVIIRSVQPFANIFKQILTKRVTIFLGVPDVYNAISRAKLPWYFMWFNKLRVFISGAAALQPKTIEAMKQKFKRTKLLEGYGLSETSPVVCVNRLERQKHKSVGPALVGYEIKIVDEQMNEVPRGEVGDIITRGENIMQGYLNRPEATAETIIGGWLLTGDMGYMDEDDYLYIVDRKKDLIISKGINIYPRELEEIIDSFEKIKVSAVVGIVDENSGEIPVAYIELEDEVEGIDESALRRYLREKLANYKVPKQIHIIDELPKNATGKVLKRVLKEKLIEQDKH